MDAVLQQKCWTCKNSKELTTGSPSPALAHCKLDSLCLSWSTTGETIFSGGNIVFCNKSIQYQVQYTVEMVTICMYKVESLGATPKYFGATCCTKSWRCELTCTATSPLFEHTIHTLQLGQV